MSFTNSNDKTSDVESSHDSSSAYDENSTRQVDVVSKETNQIEIQTLQLHTYDLWAVGMIFYIIFTSAVIVTQYNHISTGITIAIGGQYFAWNYGLTAGLGSFLVATFIVGV